MEQQPWYKRTPEETIRALSVNPEQGLGEEEAQRRIEESGPNELIRATLKMPWQLFLEQFKDFMTGLLIVAAVIAGFLGDTKDTIAIAAIVVLNAVIGYVQAFRAEKAIEALKKISAPMATVRRRGGLKTVASTALAQGDIITLEAGNIVPADCRLIEAVSLSINESILTGESHPVEKTGDTITAEHPLIADQVNMAFSGTQVTRGRAIGVVTATGMNTQIGRIAGMLQEEDIKTPLQKRLARFGRTLGLAVIVISTFMFIIGIARGAEPTLMFLTAISLVVAAVPEALPAVVTISLALGAQRMAKQKALIRRLPAVETLGSVTFICSDKTGTLTQNKMVVEQVFMDDLQIRLSGNGQNPFSHLQDISGDPVSMEKLPSFSLFMQAAILNNDAERGGEASGDGKHTVGEPTEIALLTMAENAGFEKEEIQRIMPRTSEIPFDSERKMMTTIHRLPDGDHISFTKGAFESIAPSLTAYIADGEVVEITPEQLSRFKNVYEQMAKSGQRALALAYKNWTKPQKPDESRLEHKLIFIGLIGMTDPPRQEAVKAVEECKTAGIIPVMITGDHPETAKSIAERLGIYQGNGSTIITGQQLVDLPLAQFEERVKDIRVYARVAPEHKNKIIRALQDQGEVVAMTGDGVNDAPALRQADIGVAMGITGTDVSKHAAQMVLLDDNFATIVKAIRNGRKIYDDIAKMIRYVLSTNSGEILLLFMAPIFGLPLPLLPIQILWLNLITDGLPSLAFVTGPAEKDVMRRPPVDPQAGILNADMGIKVMRTGLILAGAGLILQKLGLLNGLDWQTMLFSFMCWAELGAALALTSEKESLFWQKLKANYWLFMAVTVTFVLQLAVIYVPFLNPIFETRPLGIEEMLITLAFSLILFLAIEIEKFFRRRQLAIVE